MDPKSLHVYVDKNGKPIKSSSTKSEQRTYLPEKSTMSDPKSLHLFVHKDDKPKPIPRPNPDKTKPEQRIHIHVVRD
jgi:hypothetical protein